MHENEISGMIIKSSIEVHKQIGPGLLESAYEECLFYKLKETGLLIEKQKPIPLKFNSVNLDCAYRADFVVENKVIIEIKSVECLNAIHLSQLLTYLKITDLRLGLLINFNVVLLKDGIKRVVNRLEEESRETT